MDHAISYIFPGHTPLVKACKLTVMLSNLRSQPRDSN